MSRLMSFFLFPLPLLAGVSFDTSLNDLIAQIPVAMRVFAHRVEVNFYYYCKYSAVSYFYIFFPQAFLSDPESSSARTPGLLSPHLSCEGRGDPYGGGRYLSHDNEKEESVWKMGETFHR